MRIVQLANFIHPTSGGIRNVVDHLGRGYLDHGHQRAVIAPGPEAGRRVDPDGTVRITLPGVPVPGGSGYRLMVERRTLRAVLRALHPDAVEISDRFTLPWVARWAQRHDVTATIIVHERLDHLLRSWVSARSATDSVARRLDDLLTNTSAAIVAPSRFAAAPFASRDPIVVPWGVDLDVFAPATAPVRPPAATDRPLRIVTVSRLSREKRPDLAINVARELRRRNLDVHLDLVGDGPLRTRLERDTRWLPVTVHGHRPAAEVATILRDADVALLPCPAEAYGIAALEALACGTPIVMASTGAGPEMLRLPFGQPNVGAAGAVATPTIPALAFAIERVLRLDASATRAAAREIATQRSWDSAVAAMIALHHGDRVRAAHLASAYPDAGASHPGDAEPAVTRAAAA